MKRHTIRFTQEAYIAAVVLAAEAGIERGIPVSINELVNELLINQMNDKKGKKDE